MYLTAALTPWMRPVPLRDRRTARGSEPTLISGTCPLFNRAGTDFYPVDPADGGVHPILSNMDGQVAYTHLQRNDDPGLVCSVETRTNLVSGDWMSTGDTVRGTNMMGGGTFFNEVTNHIPVDTDQQFIRLKITNP